MAKRLSETDIRRRLYRHIKSADWKRSAALIPEYFVENASRRADLVAANGHLVAYEIKSDLDDLDRLQGQIQVFSRYFEAVTVVCTERHRESVLTATPEEVGVTCVSEDRFVVEREAKICPIADIETWLSHLPVAIIREVLAARSISSPRSGRSAVLAIARANLSICEARAAVLEYIKTKKRQQRIQAGHDKRNIPKTDPLAEHRAMLRNYLASRGIALSS